MNKVIIFLLIFCIVSRSIAEEPYCNNKCLREGVNVSKSCYCDIACSTVYDDCCSDSKHFERSKNSTSSPRSLICENKALVVNSCLKDWEGPDFILDSCKINHYFEMDPVGKSPVTSGVTGVTYNNYYCVICNRDVEHLIKWNVKISCPLQSPYLSTNKTQAAKSIFYSYSANKWGYLTPKNDSKKSYFQGCQVTSEIPEAHASTVRSCASNEIKSCVSEWRNERILEMCSSYKDPVYSNGTEYKNFYCAVCNHVDISAISCGEGISSSDNEQPKSDDSIKMNFPLLMLLDNSESIRVEKELSRSNCREGEIFDPFPEECRKIVCSQSQTVLECLA